MKFSQITPQLPQILIIIIYRNFAKNASKALKVSHVGTSTETVAIQVYEILKIDHEFLQFF